MRDYKGVVGDKPRDGGSYVKKHGYGAERFNFKKAGRKLFGYASTRGALINLTRLGGALGSASIDDITIIWTARRNGYGQVVVGWYKHATVYRKLQDTPHLHFFTALNSDSKLLKTDERVLHVPRGKGAMGRNNIWYPDGTKGRRFIETVQKLMAGKVASNPTAKSRGGSWQQDLETRLRIERKAIRIVAKHFEAPERGYVIDYVDKEKKGWDLEAVRDSINLRLEVKGLSSQFQTVELTPKEFIAMNNHKDSFRLCVISDIENSVPKIQIYEYSPEEACWISQRQIRGQSERLKIKTIQSARCSPA